MKYVWTTTLCALVALLGVISMSKATDSFTIWTAEQARRTKVVADQQRLPSINLVNHRNDVLSLAQAKKPITIVNFIYTQCPTVCNSFGFTFKRLQAELQDRNLDQHVSMLSISFDLANDTSNELNRYLLLHGADTAIWQAAIPLTQATLNRLLDRFGVVVLDDPQGGYIHNSAIYIIDPSGIGQIFDDNQAAEAVEYVAKKLAWNKADTVAFSAAR